MNIQNLGLGLVVVALAFGGAFAGAQRPVVVERVVEQLGAQAGPDVFNRWFFYDNIVVRTSNTSTSTVAVGCVQMTATSTASPIRLTFFATSTVNIDGASITSGFGGNAVQGLVLWAYGRCPGIAVGEF